VIIIIFLQGSFDVVCELFATFALGRDGSDIWNFKLAVIVHAQALRFVVPIFNDTKTNEIIRAKLLLIIQRLHVVGAQNSAGGWNVRKLRLWGGGGKRDGRSLVAIIARIKSLCLRYCREPDADCDAKCINPVFHSHFMPLETVSSVD